MVTARGQIDWPVSYDVEDMTGGTPLWIHAVQFARTDQGCTTALRAHCGPGAEEQEVLATQTDRPAGHFQRCCYMLQAQHPLHSGTSVLWLLVETCRTPSPAPECEGGFHLSRRQLSSFSYWF